MYLNYVEADYRHVSFDLTKYDLFDFHATDGILTIHSGPKSWEVVVGQVTHVDQYNEDQYFALPYAVRSFISYWIQVTKEEAEDDDD